MLELLRQRRSIRKFKKEPIPEAMITILKEALVRSPSSRNINPWRFIVVRDEALLKKLSKAKPHGASFLADAPLGIVICGNAEESDVWIEDCSIASILVQLTAQSLELGSCWIQVRNRMFDTEKTSSAYVKELLQLEEVLEIEAIIAIGIPDEIKEPVSYDDLQFGKVREMG